jgi:hypothetical protein
MAPPKKMKDAVTLFAKIERAQYEALRTLSLAMGQSIAETVRQALNSYINKCHP